MTCIIKSVSISGEEDEFLKAYKLSPSALLKEKIWEMRGMITSVAQKRVDRMTARIEQQAEEIERLNKLSKE